MAFSTINKPPGFFSGRAPIFSLDREQRFRLENVLIGCVLTNDRLAASGYVNTAACRFCDQEKECLGHLLVCPRVHEHLGAPILHDFGSNFATLGHFQHPWYVAKRRLQCSDLETIPIASAFSLEHSERVWTDGSVLFANNFWITHATYAVLDEARQIRYRGVVQHWNLSSYAAELWAVLVACATAMFPTTIFCDCKSVVEQTQFIFRVSLHRDGRTTTGGCFSSALLHADADIVGLLSILSGFRRTVLKTFQSTSSRRSLLRSKVQQKNTCGITD